MKLKIEANFGRAITDQVIEEVPEREEQDNMNMSSGLGLSNSHGHEKGSSFLQRKAANEIYDRENSSFVIKEDAEKPNKADQKA